METIPLEKRNCIPCKSGGESLSPDRITFLLHGVTRWNLAADKKSISKIFEFKKHDTALKFVNRVTEIAEQESHHPDIYFTYSKCEIKLWTHAIGGLHENDFIIAAKTDVVYSSMGG